MGKIIRPQLLKEGIIKLNSSLDNLIKNGQPVKTSFENYVGETLLTGNAYKSHKEYINEGHIPALDSQINSAEIFKETNSKYIGYIDSYLSDGTFYSEDLFEFEIRTLKRLLAESRALKLGKISDILREKLEECEKKLTNMNNFCSLTSGIYGDVATQVNDSKGKVNVLENSTYDGDTKTYCLGSSQDSEKVHEEQFIEDMKEQFGFDEDTGKIMLDVYKKLKKTYPDATQTEIDWRFTRLMGGFIYDNDPKDKFMWTDTAGSALDSEYKDNEKGYFLEKLGVSEKDYNYLRYKVRIQSGIVGGSYGNYDDIKMKGQVDAYKNKMSQVLGRDLSDEEFKKLWNEQYEGFKGKGDYSHEQITIATILCTKLNKQGIITGSVFSDEKREDEAGWLGDATLADFSKPTLGADDYISDLDSENITYIMKKENKSYMDAQRQYYSEVGKKYTRAEKFLEHTSLDEVRRKIYESSYLAQHVSYEEVAGENFDEVTFKDWPAAYNLIKSLEHGSNTLEELKK